MEKIRYIYGSKIYSTDASEAKINTSTTDQYNFNQNGLDSIKNNIENGEFYPGSEESIEYSCCSPTPEATPIVTPTPSYIFPSLFSHIVP